MIYLSLLSVLTFDRSALFHRRPRCLQVCQPPNQADYDMLSLTSDMIAGDVRLNLDPLGRHKDSELWDVLGQVELTDVATAVGGLNAPVSEDGANWSQGQYVITTEVPVSLLTTQLAGTSILNFLRCTLL